jgi:hypothetical protein
METVRIGCRLPNGITLEVGYQTSVKGSGGAPFVQYRKLADYKAITLKGTNQHLIVRDAAGKPLMTHASQRGREPFINENVPADFWQRWVAEHKDSPLLTGGQLFVVPKPADAKAVGADAKATSPALFEPMDPTQSFRVEGNVLEPRKDDE